MKKMIFVNLTVSDLTKSIDFYSKLGLTLVPEFTNEQAGAFTYSDTIHVMLVTHSFFKQFAAKEIADAEKVMEVQLAFNAESRQEVDEWAERAKAAGSPKIEEAQDQGFMYSRKFEDPDHHMWDFFYMDPAQIPERFK